MLEAARMLAQKTIQDGGSTDDARIDFLGRRLLARPFRPEERKVIKASLAELTAFYKSQPEDAKALLTVGEMPADAKIPVEQLAAWTMLTNELMNLDEVLNK